MNLNEGIQPEISLQHKLFRVLYSFLINITNTIRQFLRCKKGREICPFNVIVVFVDAALVTYDVMPSYFWFQYILI